MRAAALTIALMLTHGGAWAQCCGCVDAANLAGRITTQSVNAYTSAAIAVQTGIIVTALQGHAAQTSANIRGTITGQGLIAEAMDNHETLRQLQGDRVEAAKAYQFSTPLCQGATGSDVAIAMTVAAVPDAVRRSQANARRTAGSGGATAVAAAFDERRPLFCDAQRDPACKGVSGTRPNADRMPGSILAASRLETDADRAQATWLVQNLTDPAPVPPLTARQVDAAVGRDLYLRRGGYETKINLAKDFATEVMVTRREPTGDATFYNSLAKDSGLPIASGGVSQEDMDRMRYRDRFTPQYHTRLAINDRAALLREVADLLTYRLQQGHRTNQLLEQGALDDAALLSVLLENKLATSTSAVGGPQ